MFKVWLGTHTVYIQKCRFCTIQFFYDIFRSFWVEALGLQSAVELVSLVYMLFFPKKSKFKKYQKGKSFNKIKNNVGLKYKVSKSIKLIAVEAGRLSTKHLVAIRFLIKKHLKKVGGASFNLSPQMSISKKPLEIRMGKGKGSHSHWVSNVRSGGCLCDVFFKISAKVLVFSVLRKVQIRLPIKTKIIF